MRHILPTTLTACLLAACATGGGASPDTVAAGIARSAPPGSKILIADVPASADFLANNMIVAAQSSGMTASGSVHNILQALAADNAHIGISGRSSSVADIITPTEPVRKRRGNLANHLPKTYEAANPAKPYKPKTNVTCSGRKPPVCSTNGST